jgi:Uma2 family endonuclease
MTLLDDELGVKRFEVGTTGWTADDLDNPAVERLWDAGRHEISDGVLTAMPAARLDDGNAIVNLVFLLKAHTQAVNLDGKLSIETDVILAPMRVARVDAVYMTGAQLAAQAAANQFGKKRLGKYGRARVVPELIIENVSPGHEAHDRVTKRRWYQEARVPHYWLLDAYGRTLETLVLNASGEYQTEQLGRENDDVRPSLFPGLVIPLAKVWA